MVNIDLQINLKSLSTKTLSYYNKIGHLINDVIKVCDIQNVSGFLLSLDFEKAFDSLYRDFHITVLKNMVLMMAFIDLVKMLLETNESCVFNKGDTAKYFFSGTWS